MSKMNLTGMKNAIAAQTTTIEPYSALTENASRYFFDLAKSRASFDWSRGDVIVLTRIASWLDESDSVQEKLRIQGIVIRNQRGTEIVNPLFSIVDTLERRIMQGLTKLQITQMSLAAGALASTAKRVKNAEEVAGKMKNDDEEDLLS